MGCHEKNRKYKHEKYGRHIERERGEHVYKKY
jgi:hypothetical protein